MSYRLIIRATAEADLTDAAIWYHEQQSGLGHEFLAAFDMCVATAVANPRQFPKLLRKPEVRRVMMTRFPYRVFFVLQSDAIVVFRVLHAARHDREWKGALPDV